MSTATLEPKTATDTLFGMGNLPTTDDEQREGETPSPFRSYQAEREGEWTGQQDSLSAGQQDQLSTEQQQLVKPHRSAPSIKHRPLLGSPRRMQVLQQWEGVVTRIGQDTFEAELRDLTCYSNPPEFVELDLGDISAPDRPLLAVGSVFYWSIGYETRSGGQITKVSELRLRRMPRWTKKGIDRIRAKGQELYNRLVRNGDR